jgi:hypothetical protein
VGLNHGEIHDRKQSSATESINLSVIGKICSESEKDPEILIDAVNDNSVGQVQFVISNENQYQLQQFKSLSVEDFRVRSHQNNPDDNSHVSSVDRDVKEVLFEREDKVFYIGMKQSVSGALNQFEYVVVEVDRTPKSIMELRLNRGKFFYTKNGMFGLNESSNFQIDPQVIKLALVFNLGIKSNPTFTS